MNFLESVEAAHSSHSFNDRVSSILGITRSPTRMDSQAKYASLVRGDGGAYLRMPTGVGYREKIWVRTHANAPGRKHKYTSTNFVLLCPAGPCFRGCSRGRGWGNHHRFQRGTP